MEGTFESNKTIILNELIERRGMQHILDVATNVFGNPIFICDAGYKILCYSMDDDIHDSYWSVMKESGYGEHDMMIEIIKAGDFKKIYSTDEPQLGLYEFAPHRFMAARIRDGINVMGHICLYEYRRSFSEEDKQLLIILCKVIAYEMLYRGQTGTTSIPYYGLLTDLLENKQSSYEKTMKIARTLGVEFHSMMCLFVIRCDAATAQTSLYYIRENLMQKFVGGLGIVYKNDIVMLLPKCMAENQPLEKELADYEPNVKYRIGISYPFSNVMDLSIYYHQAMDAIEIAQLLNRDAIVCPYEKIVPYCILLYTKSDADLRQFCNPVIYEMKEYDERNHTEHVKDLEAYLSCGRNVSASADHMCIHKNSMYYRLSRIKEEFLINLDDEEICFALQLSFKILQLFKE